LAAPAKLKPVGFTICQCVLAHRLQALSNNDVTIIGSGMQTRGFCYVDDLESGLIKIMNTASYFTGPINLGNPVEFSILDLAELILKMTASKSNIIFKPLPEDDPRQRKPDINLAMSALIWRPAHSIEDGLGTTMNFFKNFKN